MSVMINSQDSYNYIGSILFNILKSDSHYDGDSTRYLFFRLHNFYNDDFLLDSLNNENNLQEYIKKNLKKLYYYNLESYIQRYSVQENEKNEIHQLYKSYEPKIDLDIHLTRKNIMQAINYLSSFYYQNELEDWDATFYHVCYYVLTMPLIYEDRRQFDDLDW